MGACYEAYSECLCSQFQRCILVLLPTRNQNATLPMGSRLIFPTPLTWYADDSPLPPDPVCAFFLPAASLCSASLFAPVKTPVRQRFPEYLKAPPLPATMPRACTSAMTRIAQN